jgi:L-ascorbate metabolism protein UlaG (beta-lactamase superfamily)
MIRPFLQDDALLADLASASDEGDRFHLWWLGQSGFLLKWRGRTVLFDPYLSDSLTRKYAATDKLHVRLTERCIAPERLAFIDLLTSSHPHTDHFDAETILPLAAARTQPLPFLLPTANLGLVRERLSGANLEPCGLDAGEVRCMGDFEFTGIAAAHDAIERDDAGHCRFLGLMVRFGPWTLYHSGDTRWYDALPGELAKFRPDVALVPINGHHPDRRVAGNLNGEEAATLAKACGAGLAIPHHFEMFEFNTATPEWFLSSCERLGQPARVLRGGERWSSPAAAASQT